jgi:TolA-binding protein
MNNVWKFSLIFIFLIVLNPLFAQKSGLNQDPESQYRTALDLFQKEKFGAAQAIFERIINETADKDQSVVVDATYYDAICALELKHKNTEFKLKNFINKYPTSSKIKRIYFQLGKYQFNKKTYRKSLESFQKVDRKDLTRSELDEYNFKTGYCYLKLKDEKNARFAFDKVLSSNSIYAPPSKYYVAHLAYLEKDYETALPVFESLREDRAYRNIVPYYLLQIYYYQKKFDQILEEGPDLYKKAKNNLRADMAKLLGGVYYQKADFTSALTYFEDFERSSRKKLERQTAYQMAFSYLKIKRYKDAIKYFQDAILQRDELAQNAYYNLGLCYIENNEKKFASNAFLSASKMDFNKQIKEEALFSYAKLSIELAHDPYNNAINSLEQYLSEYPDSDRKDEANNYLVQLYVSTKNYKAALGSMDQLKSKDPTFMESYQKIYYYSAIQLFNDKKYQESIDLFKKTIDNTYDTKIAAVSNYWIGEAFYRLQNYWGADKYYNDFLRSREARESEYYGVTKYNLAYIQFNKKAYDQAINYFKDFLISNRNYDVRFINDANLRIGDCYYITKRYSEAVKSYDAASRLNQASSDYAIFHKALAYGAMSRHGDKITTLSNLISTNQRSSYYDDALYELGTTFLIRNDNNGALQYFNKLVDEKPRSSYSKKALLRSGLIYYNDNKNTAAIHALKKVISDYSGTAESIEALASLKNIYIDMNNVDEYFRFSNSLGISSMQPSEQDSLSYAVAENQYLEANYAEAARLLNRYLNNYPQGIYLVNAKYYLAECEFRNDNFVEALKGYDYIISRPTMRFTENSLRKASRINYNLKNYAQALKNYNLLSELAESKESLLEAFEGQMRCNFLLRNYPLTINAANSVLKSDKVSSDQINEAHFLLAQAYYSYQQLGRALEEFKISEQLAENEIGAESKFMIAQISYEQKSYQEAEKIILELSNKYAYYDYWVAKAFILLSDVYIALDNTFQAKQTLMSIIENYEGEDLVEIANQKLKKINEQENI